MTTLPPASVAPMARPSIARRLFRHGFGVVLAASYWGSVAVMLVIGAVLRVLLVGSEVTVLWAVLCICGYGFGLVLCAVAGLFTITRTTRRVAVAFLTGSAAANVGLLLLVMVLAALVAAARTAVG